MELESLGTERYIALETFRKSGEGVITPVWLAGHGGCLYVITAGDSWKVKRIRNNPRVRVAASDARGNPTGPWLEASARVLEERDEHVDLLATKYGWQFRAFALWYRIRGVARSQVILEISAP